MNSMRQTFGICSIQSLLRETELYKGKIDGLFGIKCYRAFETILKRKVEQTDDYDAKTIFFNLQRAMVAMGLDTGGVDGIWGNSSQKSLEQIVKLYNKEKGIPGYSYAWSGHKQVTGRGVIKITTWLESHNKPADHTSYLLSCIGFETGGTFLTSAENPTSHALGLIQFMPSKLKEWGVNREAFAKMNFDTQLDYVFKFFEEYGYITKCKTVEDYYLSIFYPKVVGYCPDTVIGKKGTKLYDQNSLAFDKGNKGFYTIGDIAEPVVKRYWMGMDPANRTKIPLY